MTSTLTSIGNYLFGWTVITLVLSWLLAIGYPLFLRVLATASAQQASRLTLIYTLLPPAATVLSLIILSLPAQSFPFVADHCHDAVCTPHTLYMTSDTLVGLVSVIAVIAVLTGLFALMTTQLINSRKRLQALALNTRSVSYLLPGVFTAAVWITAMIAAIHFGHPLLEWLSE
jgi:hypothetical protein